jgi:hypothetical protein
MLRHCGLFQLMSIEGRRLCMDTALENQHLTNQKEVTSSITLVGQRTVEFTQDKDLLHSIIKKSDTNQI